MHDQAEELRQLVRLGRVAPRDRRRAPRKLVLSAGRSGVGATTTAVNLAVALAGQGHRAVLIDADLAHGDAAALCQVASRDTIVDVLDGRRGVHEVLQRAAGGIQIVPGAWAPDEAAHTTVLAQQRLVAELDALGAYADVLVIDCGESREALARRLWQAADAVLLLSTTATESMMDAYALAKLLLADAPAAQLWTLITQAADAASADEIQQRLAAACRRFLGRDAGAAGNIPADPALAAAVEAGKPLALAAPCSEAARAIERLAELAWSRVTACDNRPPLAKSA